MTTVPTQPATETYHFEDFTETHYRDLLTLAKAHYRFEPFGTTATQPHVLWRHDIDFSIQRALKLAEIEADMGVQSTFFVLLHSEFYNPLEKELSQHIRTILGLGHHLGLHFYANYYGPFASVEALEDKLTFEKHFLETLFDTPVTAFSYHNPDTSGILDFNQERLAGMVNTYGQPLKDSYKYCSDSNGYWRFDRLWDTLASQEHERLHILLHPGWWTDTILSPRERIQRCIQGRANTQASLYDGGLQAGGRTNVR